MPFVVRPPRAADAAPVARLRNAVWRAAYPGIVAQDVLDALDDDRSTQVWEARIDAADARGVDHNGATIRVAVDMDSDRVVGFGEVRPDEGGPTPMELTMLNVDLEYLGQGLGSRMLGVLTAARDCHTWVVAGHLRAQNFFARHGFALTGQTREHQTFRVSEVLMVRRDWSAPGF